MRLYKVLVHEVEWKKRGEKWEITNHEEKLYVGNIETARDAYRNAVNSIKHNYSYSERGVEKSGSVSLFEPEVSKSGFVQNFPWNDEYIETIEFKA